MEREGPAQESRLIRRLADAGRANLLPALSEAEDYVRGQASIFFSILKSYGATRAHAADEGRRLGEARALLETWRGELEASASTGESRPLGELARLEEEERSSASLLERASRFFEEEGRSLPREQVERWRKALRALARRHHEELIERLSTD